MELLSEDDRDLRGMTNEELAAAWDLWFDLAQTTNDDDPPFTHGVFVLLRAEDVRPSGRRGAAGVPRRDPCGPSGGAPNRPRARD